MEKPIAPTLKSIKIYETVNFPLKKYSVIAATIQRLQNETDKRFKMRKNKVINIIEIIRTL